MISRQGDLFFGGASSALHEMIYKITSVGRPIRRTLKENSALHEMIYHLHSDETDDETTVHKRYPLQPGRNRIPTAAANSLNKKAQPKS
jgi:hypothetical protein